MAKPRPTWEPSRRRGAARIRDSAASRAESMSPCCSKRNMNVEKAYRVSGHESFPCRYAWLPGQASGCARMHPAPRCRLLRHPSCRQIHGADNPIQAEVGIAMIAALLHTNPQASSSPDHGFHGFHGWGFLCPCHQRNPWSLSLPPRTTRFHVTVVSLNPCLTSAPAVRHNALSQIGLARSPVCRDTPLEPLW